MKVIIDIDEKDFRIMQHNIAVDNPLCPLSEKETVTKIANGVPISDNATNGDIIKAMFPDTKIEGIEGLEGLQCVAVSIGLGTIYFALDWWNAPYKKEVEE